MRRRHLAKIAVVATVIATIAAAVWVASGDHAPSPNRSAVIAEVASLVETKAVGFQPTTWPAARNRAIEAAASAKSNEALYAVIRELLRSLDDGGHSFALSPRQWARVQDNIGASAAASIKADAERVRLLNLPTGGSPVLLVDVPPYAGLDEKVSLAFSMKLGTAIHQAAAARPCAVIVDLRRTGGGNMWPSLTALRSLVHPDYFGTIVDRHDGLIESYRAVAERFLAADLGPEALQLGSMAALPLAILIGPGTASASEAIAAFLRARPNSVLVGQPSAGLTTTNEKFDLSDGGALILATGRLTRPTGKGYRGRMYPELSADTATEEGALDRALQWIEASPECQK